MAARSKTATVARQQALVAPRAEACPPSSRAQATAAKREVTRWMRIRSRPVASRCNPVPRMCSCPIPPASAAPVSAIASRATPRRVGTLGEAKPTQGPIQWNAPTQYLKWYVVTPTAGSYRVDVLMSAPPRTPVELSSHSGTSVSFSTSRDDDIFSNGTTLSWWDRIRVEPSLALPKGSSTLTLQLQGDPVQGALLKSLELTRAADVASPDARAQALRSDTSWLGRAKYGLMLQWGAWGMPPPGQPARSWPEDVEEFDVKAFGDLAASVGAASPRRRGELRLLAARAAASPAIAAAFRRSRREGASPCRPRQTARWSWSPRR
jgi:hypothetical protein